MTNEQMLKELKKHIDMRYYAVMREVMFIKERIMLNGDDAEAIAELQRRFNDERQARREVEMENFFKHKDIKPRE